MLTLLLAVATLTVPLPDGCTPTLSGNVITCADAPAPPSPPSPPPAPKDTYPACTAAGYTARPVSIPFPVGGNTTGGVTPLFGNTDAIVVSFTTPASGKAVFQPAGLAPTQNTSRTFTLDVVPCSFSGGIKTLTSQSPAITMTVGACPYTGVLCSIYGPYLLPNMTYYVTMVNHSCVGQCSMRLDFNKAS